MKLNALCLVLTVTCSFIAAPAFAQASDTPAAATPRIEMQQIRNATARLTYADTTFLIDPMLAAKGAYPGFDNTYRSHLRNPLVELPESADRVIADIDAVIVTHTHLDHWDDAAQKALPKDIPLFTQHEANAQLIRSQGFTDVRVLTDQAEFGGIRLTRTGGQHGTDEMYAIPAYAERLGEAMGIVFQAPEYKTLYLAGDTIWREEVDQAIETYRPDVIVLNAGKAKMTGFEGAIIMGEEDVLRASQAAANAVIVAVHMDAVNHMSLTREQLQAYVEQQGIESRVAIPEDGATLAF